jgi:hypothetical protein
MNLAWAMKSVHGSPYFLLCIAPILILFQSDVESPEFDWSLPDTQPSSGTGSSPFLSLVALSWLSFHCRSLTVISGLSYLIGLSRLFCFSCHGCLSMSVLSLVCCQFSQCWPFVFVQKLSWKCRMKLCLERCSHLFYQHIKISTVSRGGIHKYFFSA